MLGLTLLGIEPKYTTSKPDNALLAPSTERSNMKIDLNYIIVMKPVAFKFCNAWVYMDFIDPSISVENKK